MACRLCVLVITPKLNRVSDVSTGHIFILDEEGKDQNIFFYTKIVTATSPDTALRRCEPLNVRADFFYEFFF